MLEIEKLENIRLSGSKLIARCPACRADGADDTGNHLVLWPESGKFACAAHPGDREHRRLIWRLAGSARVGWRPPGLTRADFLKKRESARRVQRAEQLASAARDRAGELIFSRTWDPEELAARSPVPLGTGQAHWCQMLSRLFGEDEVVWIGEVWQSGVRHQGHFRPCSEWLRSRETGPPGPMTCPDTFKPGSVSRSGSSVATSRYLVVEADEAIGRKPVTEAERVENLRRNLCIIRWLHEGLGWRLRAIVHTGGKSCHGWFDRPPAGHIDELRSLSPVLGTDAALFASAHPVRLPAVVHPSTGVKSRLLYLL
jgi:hypothetical protein